MAYYVEAPNEFIRLYDNDGRVKDVEPATPMDLHSRGLFMAGGITNCPNWHAELRTLLEDTDLILVNPRRSGSQEWDPAISQVQITWEHTMLRACGKISFWFTNATLQPIAQYELGAWSMTGKPMAVGVEPGYLRDFDVRMQTSLARPEIDVVDSLEGLAEEVKKL